VQPQTVSQRSRLRRGASWQAGFSLLELAVALLILAIASLLLVPNLGRILASAQQVVCASNMRSIRVALGTYLEDHGKVWPQGSPLAQEPGWSDFWVRTLAPYGIRKQTWQCPTLRGLMKEQRLTEFGLHYAPTHFDATPNIANRWSTQPWLIEVADAHGQGPLICFPDGSVKPFTKVLAEQGVR
jgi:prepilin-type N-terminal cleavage/methylation domain-containing protein